MAFDLTLDRTFTKQNNIRNKFGNIIMDEPYPGEYTCIRCGKQLQPLIDDFRIEDGICHDCNKTLVNTFIINFNNLFGEARHHKLMEINIEDNPFTKYLYKKQLTEVQYDDDSQSRSVFQI